MLVDEYNYNSADAGEYKSKKPVDTYKLNYIAGIILGGGTLCAYNAVIAGSDYYQDSFPGKKLEYYAPLATSIVSPILQFCTYPLNRYLGKNICIYLSLLINAIAVALIPVFGSSLNESEGFIAVLACMLTIGALGAINLGSVFGYFSIFPPEFMQAVMAGQGWSGVLVSVLRVITKYAYKDDKNAVEASAKLYFTVAAIFTLLCVVAFTYLKNTSFTKYYIERAENLSNNTSTSESSLLNDESLVNDLYTPDDSLASAQENIPISTTLYKILPAIANVASIFIITFLCFPGLLASIKPTLKIDGDWFTVINITLFNIFDLIGRTLPSYFILWNEANVYIPILVRFICYPLFLLAARSEYEFFNESIFVFVLNMFFAVSNGYLSSIVMMTVGNFVTPKEREAASTFLSAILTGSILVGSMLAILSDSLFDLF